MPEFVASPDSPLNLLPQSPEIPPPPSPQESNSTSQYEELFYQLSEVRKDLSIMQKNLNKIANLQYFMAAHCKACHLFPDGVIWHNGFPRGEAGYCLVPKTKAKSFKCFCNGCQCDFFYYII